MFKIDPKERPLFPCGHPRTDANSYYKGNQWAYCKKCDNERSKLFRKKNPAYSGSYQRGYREKNRTYVRYLEKRRKIGARRSQCRLAQVWR